MREALVESAQLSNGLRVIVCPQPHLQRAHVGLFVRVGSRFESARTNGLSHFLEHMMYRGTPSLPRAHDVNLAFEELGGYLYAATHVDYGVFSVTMPPESLSASVRLFGDVITQPAFSDIELEKEIVCEEILEDLDEDGAMVDPDNLSRALIYPHHPLGFTITGDEHNVRSFDRAMLHGHHKAHYTAENSVLVFSGNVRIDDALELARASFCGMPKGARVDSPEPTHDQTAPRVHVVDSASSQTELRVCFRAVSDRAAERPAVEMLMRLVDDGMSTRLYHRICDAKGLCYDVSGGYEGYDDDGVIDLAASVQPTRASIVTRELLSVLRDLRDAAPTERELDKARRRHAWDLAAMLDSPDDLGSFFGTGMLFGRFETLEARQAAYQAVSAEDIRRAAEHIAQPERLNVVAVGAIDDGEDDRLRDAVMTYARG